MQLRADAARFFQLEPVTQQPCQRCARLIAYLGARMLLDQRAHELFELVILARAAHVLLDLPQVERRQLRIAVGRSLQEVIDRPGGVRLEPREIRRDLVRARSVRVAREHARDLAPQLFGLERLFVESCDERSHFGPVLPRGERQRSGGWIVTKAAGRMRTRQRPRAEETRKPSPKSCHGPYHNWSRG